MQDTGLNKTMANTTNDILLPDDIGSVRIADEVISIVASLSAQEVEGVADMSGGFTEGLNEFLGKTNTSKGVRILVEGHTVSAEIYVIVEYGACIPEVAMEIQEKVRCSIEDMTGYEVKNVDVHIQGVQRRKLSELEKALEIEDELKHTNKE